MYLMKLNCFIYKGHRALPTFYVAHKQIKLHCVPKMSKARGHRLECSHDDTFMASLVKMSEVSRALLVPALLS